MIVTFSDLARIDHVEFWNLETTDFVEGPALPFASYSHTLLEIQGSIYFIGGGRMEL